VCRCPKWWNLLQIYDIWSHVQEWPPWILLVVRESWVDWIWLYQKWSKQYTVIQFNKTVIILGCLNQKKVLSKVSIHNVACLKLGNISWSQRATLHDHCFLGGPTLNSFYSIWIGITSCNLVKILSSKWFYCPHRVTS
jgi:hypothetical protein